MDVHDKSTTWINNGAETSDCAMDYSRRAGAHLQQTGDFSHLGCAAAQSLGLSGRVSGCEQQDRGVERLRGHDRGGRESQVERLGQGQGHGQSRRDAQDDPGGRQEDGEHPPGTGHRVAGDRVLERGRDRAAREQDGDPARHDEREPL